MELKQCRSPFLFVVSRPRLCTSATHSTWTSHSTVLCIIFHLPHSHAVFVPAFLSTSQVTAMTTGQEWGEDIKWSLTSRLVRPTQPLLWLGCLTGTVTHILLHRLRTPNCNTIKSNDPPTVPTHLQPYFSGTSWRHRFCKRTLIIIEKQNLCF